MSAAELVGDLAVLYAELAATPPPWRTWSERTNTFERFAHSFHYGERLFRLAIEAGIAVAQAPEPPRAALAALADTVETSYLLDELTYALQDGFSYVGYELGYFYGGQPWDELCWFRSGITFIASLAGIALDDTSIEDNMQRYAGDLYEPLDVPPGMPAAHWWWFGDGT